MRSRTEYIADTSFIDTRNGLAGAALVDDSTYLNFDEVTRTGAWVKTEDCNSIWKYM